MKRGIDLWTYKEEENFIKTTDAIIYTIISCEKCNYRYRALFRKSRPTRCPRCNGSLRSNTPQNRNAPVANYTEKFVLKLINKALDILDEYKNFEAKREVVCNELDLTSGSAADIAIVEKGNNDRIYKPNQIKLIFEVKMSLVWNWEPDKNGKPKIESDYDRHRGRGSIYRTDSILKAIGKGAILRSHFEANKIPYVVIGNCPPPPNYISKIDGSVRAGIVQKFISVNPNPLQVDKSNSKERNPKKSKGGGFLRIDTQNELSLFIKSFLEKEQVFIGSMLEKEKLGEIIKSLDLTKDLAEIGEDFF